MLSLYRGIGLWVEGSYNQLSFQAILLSMRNIINQNKTTNRVRNKIYFKLFPLIKKDENRV